MDPILGGTLAHDNQTLMADCITGKHLRTYDTTCAPHMSLQMVAVVVAVMQVGDGVEWRTVERYTGTTVSRSTNEH